MNLIINLLMHLFNYLCALLCIYYLLRLRKWKITPELVAKVVPNRIFSLAIHPSEHKVRKNTSIERRKYLKIFLLYEIYNFTLRLGIYECIIK